MIRWDHDSKSVGAIVGVSDTASWMRLRVLFPFGKKSVSQSVWDAIKWAFECTEMSDGDRRLSGLDVCLGRKQYHPVSWVHGRSRSLRGYVRHASVYVIKDAEWPKEMVIPEAAVNPGVGELVGARVTGGKKPWWRYRWSKVTFRDEAEATLFGVTQAAWYCLRKEKSIHEDNPTYPAAARHGVERLEAWRAGEEPKAWL